MNAFDCESDLYASQLSHDFFINPKKDLFYYYYRIVLNIFELFIVISTSNIVKTTTTDVIACHENMFPRMFVVYSEICINAIVESLFGYLKRT